MLMRGNAAGDAMVRELEFSRITLQLTAEVEGDKRPVVAKLTGNTLDTLKRCLVGRSLLSF